jgi:hypothetical protein
MLHRFVWPLSMSFKSSVFGLSELMWPPTELMQKRFDMIIEPTGRFGSLSN